MTVWIVWGLAAGRGTTSEAARGALTVREYPAANFPREDWLEVISVNQERHTV